MESWGLRLRAPVIGIVKALQISCSSADQNTFCIY